MPTKLTLFAAVLVIARSTTAAPLTEARVNKIINEVAVVDAQSSARAAKLNDVITPGAGVKTGIKSRSELLFQDQTLMRVGPETFFTFTGGTREMALREGTMLLQVPKGLGGAKIRTAAVTAAITGTTIMLEHRPGKHIKVLVLEGSLRLSVNGTFGDALLLTPGKMVIMPPNAKRIPDPIAVDIASVVRTSSLVTMSNRDRTPLPSMNLIQREIDRQARAVASTTLVPTNLVINGAGTNVMMADQPPAMDMARRQQVGLTSVSANSTAPAGTADLSNDGLGTPGTTVNVPNVPPNNGNNGNHGNGNNGNGNGNNGNGNNGNGNNGNNGNAQPGNANGNQSQNGNGRGLGNGGPATIVPAPGDAPR